MGSKERRGEIKDDAKVARRNIHLTRVTVLIEAAGHGFCITQQGCAIALYGEHKSHYDFHTSLHGNHVKIKVPIFSLHNFKKNTALFPLGSYINRFGCRFHVPIFQNLYSLSVNHVSA